MARKYNTGCKYFDEWFELCDSDDYPVCEDIILLNELILEKIRVQKIVVNVKKVDEMIRLIEKYRPYKLAPVQKFLHCIPYTYFPSGEKVWDEMLIYAGRGFGKNAWLSDYGFCATSNKNGIKNYNVDIVATSEAQAKTSFQDIYETTEHQELKRAYHKTLEKITFLNTNSDIKYYTSNAKTKDGLRPGTVVFDEIHAYQDYENIKVFTSALGKIEGAMAIYLTTDGNVRGCVLDDKKNDGKRILREKDLEDTFFPFLAHIDKFEEWEDPKCWIKANPMLPYNKTLYRQYHKDFRNAQKYPQMKLEFLLKRLNWVVEDTTMAVAPWEEIKNTSCDINWNDFSGMSCVGGVDYASIRDFISVGLLFKKNGQHFFKHHTFIVEESLRLTQFKIDIDLAVSQGLVTIVRGKTMDPDLLAEWFIEQICKFKFNILNIAADDYRRTLLDESFSKRALPLNSVRSGPITHGKLAPVIEKLFSDGNIKFGDDMMMRWYTNNVKVVTSPKGNKSYEKIEPIKRKTDGFMAFVHAMAISDELIDRSLGILNNKLKSYTYS